MCILQNVLYLYDNAFATSHFTFNNLFYSSVQSSFLYILSSLSMSFIIPFVSSVIYTSEYTASGFGLADWPTPRSFSLDSKYMPASCLLSARSSFKRISQILSDEHVRYEEEGETSQQWVHKNCVGRRRDLRIPVSTDTQRIARWSATTYSRGFILCIFHRLWSHR